MNQNLRNQFYKLIRLDNTGSFETKRTYRQVMKQFLDCCSDNFHAQNINRLGDKHIRYFIEEQMDAGVSRRSMQTETAGIRHFLLIAGARFSVTNQQLGIAGKTGEIHAGVSRGEYARTIALCRAKGKAFEELAVKAMYFLGLRSNEAVNLRYGEVREAERTGELSVLYGTKGGRKRTIVLDEEQAAVVRELAKSRLNPDGRTKSDKIFCARAEGSVKSQKQRLHNFFFRYRGQLEDPGRKDSLSCHSFRRAAAQRVYNRERRIKSDRASMAAVRDFLGHGLHRPDIDAVYVYVRKPDPKSGESPWKAREGPPPAA